MKKNANNMSLLSVVEYEAGRDDGALHGARSAAGIMRTYERGRRGGLTARTDGLGARGYVVALPRCIFHRG